MLHLFHGFVRQYDKGTYLDNGIFGVEVSYEGTQKEGTYFLFPQFDQNNNTYRYYAFDSIDQKQLFLQLMKIQGIGSKNAYQIAQMPHDELSKAIESYDMNYFQQIPGVGPKTAKRLLIELKQNFEAEDMQQLNVDEKLYQEIVDSLKGLGYSANRIKKLLPKAPYKLERDNLPEIMKWMIDKL